MSTIDTKDPKIMNKFVTIIDGEDGKTHLVLNDFNQMDIIETYNGAVTTHDVNLMISLMEDYLKLLDMDPSKKYGKVFLKNLDKKYSEFMNSDVRGRLFIYLFMSNAYDLKKFLMFTEADDEQELA